MVTTAAATAADTDLEALTPVGTPAAREHSQPLLRLLSYEPDPGRPAPPEPPTPPVRRPHLVPAEAADPVELRRHVERVLRLTFEVLDGRRPLGQLAPHLAPSTVRYMRAALAQRPARQAPSRMTSLHLCLPRSGVAEVAAVYRRGPGARALAARFERACGDRIDARSPQAGGRPEWRCVALRLL
jgi:hypothetical protein